MAKKRKRSGGRGRTKRTRGQKAVLHVSDLIVIIWLLERCGLLDSATFNYLVNGNIELAIANITTKMKGNFTGTGVAVTIASGVSIALVLGLLRLALKGHTMSMKKPKAIAV